MGLLTDKRISEGLISPLVQIPGVYLYNVGDEKTALTGGWSLLAFYTSGTSTTTKNASNIETVIAMPGASAVQSIYKTTNQIDLTNFSKIAMQVEMATTAQLNASHAGRAVIDIYDTTTLVSGQQYPTSLGQTIKSIAQNSSYNGTVELDISSINGLHYVDFQAWYTNVNGNVKTVSIWLE